MPPAIVWVGWLALFLVYEVYAALSHPKGDTFSENVWGWFDTVPRKIVLAVFLLTLTSHLVLGTPHGAAIVVTGIPVGILIGLRVVRR